MVVSTGRYGVLHEHPVMRKHWIESFSMACSAKARTASEVYLLLLSSQLATYDQAKEALLRHRLMRDGFPAHITASFTAGFVASVTSSPLDVIKTRLMSMKVSPGGKAPYSGALDCAIKTVQAEGVMALYKVRCRKWCLCQWLVMFYTSLLKLIHTLFPLKLEIIGKA